MKKIILNFEHKTNNLKELVQEAFNQNILNFLISSETIEYFEGIERITRYSTFPEDFSQNIVFNTIDDLQKYKERYHNKRGIGFFKILKLKKDEVEICNLIEQKILTFIIILAPDWKVIPFENLISISQSKDIELIACIQDLKEAELLLKTLEIGVDGILFSPKDVNELKGLKKLINSSIKLDLKKARILKIQALPENDRVCVDTTSLLQKGEGMLVGSTAQGFVLIHSETIDTKFVRARPFRVNAGDVSSYILVPGEDLNSFRTKYLSELKGGDKVLVVNTEGLGRIVSIGRVKIETRPMLRFELETIINNEQIPISCICQNAETIRLVDSEGNAIPVVDIKVGDEILVCLGPKATHFGTKIKERIIEK